MIGFDHLGFAHPKYPRKDVCELTPEGSAIGVFHNEFGPVIPHIREALIGYPGKFPVWRIQVWWGGDAHAPVPYNFLKEAAPKYEKLKEDFPDTTFYLSHSCEYRNTTVAEVRQRISIIRNLAPHCLRVDNPENGRPIRGPIGETHDPYKTLPNPYLYSSDGKNVYDIDIGTSKKIHRSSLISFFWGGRFNLRQITDPGDPVLPPLKREATPSRAYIKSVIRLTEAKGDAPQAFPRATSIHSPYLYKSHSEDSANKDGSLNNDPRHNKPVLILPGVKTPFEVITCRGDVIGSLVYGGDYKDGLKRFYSGMPGGANLYGYELGEIAFVNSGSEFVWFRQGSKIYGPVNPAFRQGYFHG